MGEAALSGPGVTSGNGEENGNKKVKRKTKMQKLQQQLSEASIDRRLEIESKI